MHTIPSGTRSSCTSATVSCTGSSVAAIAAGTGALPLGPGSGDSESPGSMAMQNQ